MSGQGVLRAMQNNNMPLLDLFVREAVQNSLDAYRTDSKYVQVDFGINDFDSDLLAEELEGITDSIKDLYDKDSKCLFIKDTGTVGLTGPLHFTQKQESENNNLLNLVYEIAKPQEGKGAGGSWGYGKTIYFRMGIGLVLYYSRIRTDNNQYQSRLAACLVEDEKSSSSLLARTSLNAKRGLAWWGDEFEFELNGVLDTGTIPLTDEERIKKVVDIFGVEPFADNETGTVVIIPYIDEEKLLTNNISTESTYIPWGSSVEEYLRIATQRWYIGRLNNKIYSQHFKLPWLRASINGKGIMADDIAPTFEEVQKLYNIALKGKKEEGYKCEPIRLNSLFSSTTVGHVAYRMYSLEDLGCKAPINAPSPFLYVKNEDGTDDYKDGDIIVSFFRKPGMAVTYDSSGEWVNKIKCNNERSGDVLFVVFVLNSDNKFIDEKLKPLGTIEEYFRSSEKSDHTAWFDINYNDKNPKILQKIQFQIRRKINDSFKKEEVQEAQKSSSLSNMFGEFLLPPEGFGKKAKGKKGGSTGQPGITIKHKKVRLRIDEKKAQRSAEELVLPFSLDASEPFSKISVIFEVSTDGKSIPIELWGDRVGTEMPFEVKGLDVSSIQVDKKTVGKDVKLERNKSRCHTSSYSMELMKTSADKLYGIRFDSDYNNINIQGTISFTVNNQLMQLGYQIREGA